MENYTCEYCQKNFESNNALGPHKVSCFKNPYKKERTEKWLTAVREANKNKKKSESDSKVSKKEKSEKWLAAMAARKGLSINGWQKINWDDIPFEELSKNKKRQRLLKECNNSCTQCGFNKTRNCGRSILEIDHIDGNHNNNSKNNLRVLCPNCHALTPNYRNWGRSSKEKTSSRFRCENSGYQDFVLLREEKKNKKLQIKQDFENNFIKKVYELHENKEIDFNKNGWIKKLSIVFNEAQQVTSRRLKRLMPDFYEEHCYSLSKKYQKN
jgi:hypothetical protein